jgi:hypothetical protein
VFDQLKKTQVGLILFKHLLSGSLDQTVSHAFDESNVNDSDQIGVLFEINTSVNIKSKYKTRKVVFSRRAV